MPPDSIAKILLLTLSAEDPNVRLALPAGAGGVTPGSSARRSIRPAK
jgi:hypothetical protein